MTLTEPYLLAVPEYSWVLASSSLYEDADLLANLTIAEAYIDGEAYAISGSQKCGMFFVLSEQTSNNLT